MPSGGIIVVERIAKKSLYIVIGCLGVCCSGPLGLIIHICCGYIYIINGCLNRIGFRTDTLKRQSKCGICNTGFLGCTIMVKFSGRVRYELAVDIQLCYLLLGHNLDIYFFSDR